MLASSTSIVGGIAKMDRDKFVLRLTSALASAADDAVEGDALYSSTVARPSAAYNMQWRKARCLRQLLFHVAVHSDMSCKLQ